MSRNLQNANENTWKKLQNKIGVHACMMGVRNVLEPESNKTVQYVFIVYHVHVQNVLHTHYKGYVKMWIGFDFDGTLAREYTLEPIQPIVKLLKGYLDKGIQCKIVTARAGDSKGIDLVRNWLKEHDLPDLQITNQKDYQMVFLYDDRARQVIPNQGIVVSDEIDKLKLKLRNISRITERLSTDREYCAGEASDDIVDVLNERKRSNEWWVDKNTIILPDTEIIIDDGEAINKG